MIREIAVRLDNRPGELSRVLVRFRENLINILAFSIDVDEQRRYCILRLIPDSIEKSLELLTDAEYSPETHIVYPVKIAHRAGSLRDITNLLSDRSINIQHSYLTLIPFSNDAIVVFKTSQRITNDILEGINGTVLTDISQFEDQQN